MADIKQIISHLYKDLQNGHWVIQSNEIHTIGVAERTSLFASEFGLGAWGRVLGMLHDKGKETNAFQQHIRKESGYAPEIKVVGDYHHAYIGGILARKLYGKSADNFFVNQILSHHSGLHDSDELDGENSELKKNIPTEVNTNIEKVVLDKLFFKCEASDFHHLSRMLYSCLVDADYLDTEAFMDKADSELRANKAAIKDLLPKLEAYLHNLKVSAKDTQVNHIRNKVQQQCINTSMKPIGFYSLTVPTGGGKTLSSLVWAMKHAIHNGQKRIIIAIPYTSIIVQTAAILREIFGSENVLEHHSNVDPEQIKDERLREQMKLATENWDYPIVITTTVQFFESLFSNQRSKCRKLHNLQDSIVIFDEIQTLPVHLAECTMKMLNDMLHLCHCSILFCTATQPNFQTRSDFKGIDRILPLVENPTAIFAATKRVEYYPIADYEVQSIGNIVKKVCEENESVLIVCNTKKKARALFDGIRERSNIPVLHLSTNMCQVHRMAIIDKVRSKLKKGEKLILCSTQLIEAGVDMDFPVVFRELAPLESIIQSAGRCNREGKLEKGKVFLFQLEEKGQPSAKYETFAQFAQLCYRNNESRLTDADFYAEYYTDIIKLYAPDDTITPEREKLMFQNVADKYHIIDSSATSLFIYRYNEESLQLYKEITDKEYLSRKDYQEIAKYSVQVYKKFEHDNSDKIAEASNGIKNWSGAYSKEFGLSNEEEFFCI